MKQFKFDLESSRLRKGKSSYLIRFGIYIVILIVLFILLNKQFKKQGQQNKPEGQVFRNLTIEVQPAEQQD